MDNKIYNLLNIASIALWYIVNLIIMIANKNLNYRID